MRGETLIRLPARELSVLRLLLARPGQVIAPQQFLQAAGDRPRLRAEELPDCIASLRARLAPKECIETVYKRGYRFMVQVRASRPGSPPSLPGLAILPFELGRGIPEYLGPAIAEQTFIRLAGIRPDFVNPLPLDSVFTLALRGADAVEIGRKIHADLVLSGSVHSLPSQYRVRAQMTRPADGSQLWVEDLLIPQDSLPDLDTELATRLAFRLAGANLSISAASGEEQQNAPARGAAFYQYLRAHHEWQTLQRHRMQDGLRDLLSVIETDPTLVAARVDVANLCVAQALYGFMSPTMAAETARTATKPIPRGDPRADSSLPALGWISFHVDRSLPKALRLFSFSEHVPHDPWVTRARVMLALSRHRFDEALELLDGAIRIDPYSPWLQARRAWALHLAGRAEESIEQARNALLLFPDHEGAQLYSIIILAFNGQVSRAVSMAADLAQRLPYFDLGTSAQAYALACAGQKNEAQAVLERLQWLSRERYVLNTFTPAVYVALGDHDSALRELRISAEARCPWFFQTLADPRLKPLSGEKLFQAMLDELAAFEQEAAAAEDSPGDEQVFAETD
jgi:tetratricopeptide (TPR) repeat protein/TolB-like protein